METREKTFVLSPTRQEIELKAGGTYEGSILIANPNTATEDFEYKITVMPYSVSGSDYKPDFETMSDWSKIVDWTTFEEPTGVLAPNESKEIFYKIEVPLSAPAGGQYAMIGVSSVPSEGSKKTEVHDTYTLSSLIYARVDGETVHAGEILENQVPGFVSSGTPTTIVTVTNTGNVHEKLSVELSVKNVFTGERLSLSGEETDTYESLILPDSTRVVSRTLDGLAGLGIFKVTQDVSYLDESSSATTVMVICPIWFMILSIVTVTVIFTTLAYKIRKTLKRLKKLKVPDDPSEAEEA